MHRRDIPLWPLPAAIALILLLGTHAAWALSVQAGIVPPCIPYLEGCTSISRAAREGPANPAFRLLMLPCAPAIGLHWWLAGRWLAAAGAHGRMVRTAGVLAAVALAVYVAFLGTEGEAYRFLRRYGVVAFFGAGFLAQVAFLRALGSGALARRASVRALRAVCVLMLLLGVAHVVALAAVGGSPFQDRFENALEWLLGLGLVAWFAAHAALWRAVGAALRLEVGRGLGRS
ncbi:hypothetical protein [Luteimonas huabeiensis]|uniref:hypothetical protein n=1 Tax=Luteimonas huabeiensis TaxID=1244513 RepID=UPI000465200A|nr:hypothetical protein [Luteimonas huabeiensis]